MPSPVVAYSEKMTWPDCSPPSADPRRSISSRTYLSPTGVRSILICLGGQRFLEPDIRHDGGNDQIARQLACTLQGRTCEKQNGVAIDNFPLPRDEQRPIGITVERNSEVGAGFDNTSLQILKVQRAAVQVDVAPVRRSAQPIHFHPELVKEVRRHLGCRSIRAIDHEMERKASGYGSKKILFIQMI